MGCCRLTERSRLGMQPVDDVPVTCGGVADLERHVPLHSFPHIQFKQLPLHPFSLVLYMLASISPIHPFFSLPAGTKNANGQAIPGYPAYYAHTSGAPSPRTVVCSPDLLPPHHTSAHEQRQLPNRRLAVRSMILTYSWKLRLYSQ